MKIMYVPGGKESALFAVRRTQHLLLPEILDIRSFTNEKKHILYIFNLRLSGNRITFYDYKKYYQEEKMRKKVYIASPYTIGNIEANVERQLACGDELLDNGFLPFIPLLYHYQHAKHPRDYEDWLAIDKEWILSCDALLRLSGESVGADIEVSHAQENNIPVFYSVEDLCESLV